MSCCSCEYLHKTTALTTAGVLTVTNPNNIGEFDRFCLVLTINPDSIITGAPAEYTVTINGTAVPIWDIYGLPITTDVLCTRKVYKGRYIGGTTPHVTLTNVLSAQAQTATTKKTGA